MTTTIAVDRSLPKGYPDHAAECPHRRLPTALIEYIDDYAQAHLQQCSRNQCEPPTSAEVNPAADGLTVTYGQESDFYCILLQGTPEGLVVTLKYNGGAVL